ncbi:MAG: cation diffusion facilitator family transporter [Planctomycetota bacterium]|jgi:cation diffusion facilitator family transporter
MLQEQKKENAGRQMRSVTNISIVTNLLLSAVKIVVGIVGRSMALVADGIHSLSDIATDLTVLLGIRLGSKEADPKHPYGHGRMETFSALGVAFVLILVGAWMIYRAAAGINDEIVIPAPMVLIVAIISIIVKEVLFHITRKVAVATHSSALYANAWHHRSDSLSSVVVVIGIVSMMLFDFRYGDRLAAIGVGLMIALVGGNVMASCFQEFTEASVDERTIKQIMGIIEANSFIRQWHKLRTRTVGREVFLDLHILVDPGLNIAAAHEIAESLEEAMHEEMAQPVNITVHIEPDTPELRK